MDGLDKRFVGVRICLYSYVNYTVVSWQIRSSHPESVVVRFSENRKVDRFDHLHEKNGSIKEPGNQNQMEPNRWNLSLKPNRWNWQ